MNFLFLIIMFFCISCSSESYKPRIVEDYYNSTGVERFYLSDIPAWINFSEKAGCFRKTQVKFFDIDALMKNYGVDFNKAIQIQGMYNEEFHQTVISHNKQNISLLDQQNLFFKASEKINGKIPYFETPNFTRINLVWIDSMLVSQEEEKKLRNFLKSPVFDLGIPVLVSLCLTKHEIDEKFPEFNYKKIPVELLTIFNPDGTKSPVFKFHFDYLFKSNQQLFFYSREKIQSSLEFNGKLKFFSF